MLIDLIDEGTKGVRGSEERGLQSYRQEEQSELSVGASMGTGNAIYVQMGNSLMNDRLPKFGNEPSIRVNTKHSSNLLGDLEVSHGQQKMERQDGLFSCLVIDENYFNLFAMQSLLTQFNASVEIVMNGNEGIKLVQQLFYSQDKTFDLILIDQDSADLDGIQVAQLIRSFIRESAKRLKQPFIACFTAQDNRAVRERALQAGVDSVKIKPIFKKTLQIIL